MNFDERRLGKYTVYAAALEDAAACGYVAAVVVTLGCGAGLPQLEVFRNEALEDRKLWPSAPEALDFALDIGEAAANAHEVLWDFRLLQSGQTANEGASRQNHEHRH
jgi:hypothetical protein